MIAKTHAYTPPTEALRLVLVAIFLLWQLTGCSVRTQIACPPAVDGAGLDIYIVNHGWHSGLVLPAINLLQHSPPVAELASDQLFFEVGYGDERFYQSEHKGLGTTLRAALYPTTAVLHIVRFNQPVGEYMPASDISRLTLSSDSFAAILSFIDDSLLLDDEGRPQIIGPGLYGDSLFVKARQRFHLLHNCNIWANRALAAAGCQ